MKRLTLSMLVAALLLLAVVTPACADTPSVYVVRWGDTLSGIAARFGLRTSELAEANNLPWYAWVYVGQRLVIPGGRPEPGSTYTVQPGDTLWEIAVRFGTTVRALMEANGLQSSWIYPGQQLVIPGPDSETEAVDGWTGTIVKLPAGNQFGQYFQRDDGERYGIDSIDAQVGAQITAFRDSGDQVRVWGRLFTGVPAVEARHIEVERIEAVSSDGQRVEGWSGTVVKLPAGSQFGQYFQRDDGERYDIGGASDAVRDLIGEYAWSGATVKVWGTLFTGVPATLARHIEAERIEQVSGPAGSRNLSPFAKAAASSALRSDRWGNYQTYCAVDGTPETSWVEGVDGPGAGEWLTLTFPGAVVVDRVGIDVGYDRDAAIFAANNRVKRATVVFSSGEQVQASFADQRGVQMVSLDHAVETSTVTVIIEEVYPGSRYDDTCLAEVQVWGKVK